MRDERFDAFKRLTLKGQPLPDDLQKLWLMQASRGPDTKEATDPLAKIGARLIEPGMDVTMLSDTYLTEQDRADPDIMANVAGFEAVFALSTMVVDLDAEFLLGYWHGPEGTPIDKARIFWVDTEGQFEIARGRTLTEAIVAFDVRSDSDFAQQRDWWARHGILIAASTLAELEYDAFASDPHDVHIEAYNRHRISAGLPPFQPPAYS
jgi:hypothetical protein